MIQLKTAEMPNHESFNLVTMVPSVDNRDERTLSPPPRVKSPSPPHAPSKSTSSKSTSLTSSRTLKNIGLILRTLTPMKHSPQEDSPINSLPQHTHVSNMVDLPPSFAYPPPVQNLPMPLFFNINNNQKN
nr:hypothetical protein [Tanacetum cinerariifolium]